MLRITLLALAITLLAPPASAQSRCSSDGLGGYRCQDTQTGSTTTYRSDGLGGSVITQPDGSTTRCRSDGLGGYRCF